MSTFFSDSPDSPINWGINNTFHSASQDGETSLADARGPEATEQGASTAAPDAQIAPWLSADSSTSYRGADTGSFFEDRPRRAIQANEPVDPLFCGSDRRPSMASATTVSSQNSVPISRASTSRGNPNKRLGAFFGDDGLDSARSSDTGVITTGRDPSASSQSRKARHNSVQTNNTDGRTSSPSSSRPRSPLPSSDVTPWLFQDFKVSARDDVCPCATYSMHACPTVYLASYLLVAPANTGRNMFCFVSKPMKKSTSEHFITAYHGKRRAKRHAPATAWLHSHLLSLMESCISGNYGRPALLDSNACSSAAFKN